MTTRVRELAAAVDPALRVVNLMPLPRVVDVEVAYWAFWVRLFVTLSCVALGLSLAGVYAVTAFAVAKRTREIGVRVALGARPLQIIVTVFKRPVLQIALGIGVGAVIVTTLVTVGNNEVTLREVTEPGTFVLILGFVCMLGCIVPTRRALRIQPTEALKDEG
jgi:ABC-type antimicrobial peptide transport system permease subunit